MRVNRSIVRMDAKAEGHVFGNFPNYYAFNPVIERLKFFTLNIRNELCSPNKDEISMVDLGCNDGALTIHLHHFLETGCHNVARNQDSYNRQATSDLNHIVQKSGHLLETRVFEHERTSYRCELYLNRVFFGQGIDDWERCGENR